MELDNVTECAMAPTPTTSGAMEVQVIGGPLVHSKLGGMGHVDSQDKEDAIEDKIDEYVKSQAA